MFSIVKEQLGLLLQSVMMLCCVLTQGLCWAHSTSTHTALLSALHVSWSWGIRIDQAVLKSETPDCQYSIYPCLESAGISNTAP
jgi:hypothetical protein